MRSAFIAIIAALSAAVLSQTLSELPQCSQNCVGNSLTTLGCSPLNITCICASSIWISELSCCISQVCSPQDQQTTISFVDQLCETGGVTLPSVASCASSSTPSVVSSPISSMMSTTSTTNVKSSSLSSSSSTSATQASTMSSGLSSAAKIGIGLGVPLGVIIFTLIALGVYFYGKRQRLRGGELPQPSQIYEPRGQEWKHSEMPTEANITELP